MWMMVKYKWLGSFFCAWLCVWSCTAMAGAVNVQPNALRDMMGRDVYPAEWTSRPWQSVVPRLAPTALDGAYERAPISWLTAFAPKSTPLPKNTPSKTRAQGQGTDKPQSKAVPKAPKTNANEFVPEPLGTVAISPEVGVTLARVTALSVDKIKTFYFTFTINNRSSKEFDFNNYWFSIRGSDGAVYKVRPVDSGALNNAVPVRSERQVEVSIQTPKNVSGFTLGITLFRWNFSMKDFQEPIGTYAIPKTYKNASPSNKIQRLTINEVPLRMSIEKTTVSEDEKYKYVNVYVKIKNIGVIKSGGGSGVYLMKLLTRVGLQFDMNGTIDLNIPPQDESEYPLNGRVPQSVDLRNAQLMLVKSIASSGSQQGRDGNAAVGAFMPVAVYVLDYKPRVGAFVPVGKSVRLEVESKPVIANVKSAVAKPTGKKTDADGQKQTITVSLIAKNDGREAITLTYKYRLKTARGEFYELNPGNSGQQASLLPKIPLQIELTGTIPKSTSLKNLVLLVSESGGSTGGGGQGGAPAPPASTGELRIPVATFALSFQVQAERASSETFSYSDDQFAYDVRINDVDRVPVDDGNDYIFVAIDVTNRSASDAPMPSWTGQLWFDGISRNVAQMELINTGRVNAIRPGETVQMTYRAKISFARSYQKLTIKIVDGSTGSAETKDAPAAKDNEVLLAVDTRKGEGALLSPAQTKYVVVQDGIRSEVNVVGTRLYQGKSEDTLVTLMEWTNLEQRNIAPPGLYALYRTDKGTIVVATIDHKADRVEPQEKTLFVVKANVPKNIKRENVQLFIGVGTKGSAIDTNSSDAPDGYIALRPMAPNNETVEQKQSLMNIVVKPYTVSIQKYKLTPTDGSSFTFDMTVRVDQGKEYKFWPRDRKLIFEVTDLFTGNKTEKIVTFEGTGADQFSVGTQDKTMTFQFSGTVFQSFQSFSLRVYEAVDRSGTKEDTDSRKLLLSEVVGRWFTQY
jgi:hypothetical protein